MNTLLSLASLETRMTGSGKGSSLRAGLEPADLQRARATADMSVMRWHRPRSTIMSQAARPIFTYRYVSRLECPLARRPTPAKSLFVLTSPRSRLSCDAGEMTPSEHQVFE